MKKLLLGFLTVVSVNSFAHTYSFPTWINGTPYLGDKTTASAFCANVAYLSGWNEKQLVKFSSVEMTIAEIAVKFPSLINRFGGINYMTARENGSGEFSFWGVASAGNSMETKLKIISSVECK